MPRYVDAFFSTPSASTTGNASVAPLDAVRTWLAGGVHAGDEDALCAAIRRDPDVTLTDDEIASVFYEVLGDDDFHAGNAERVLMLLREAARYRIPGR